MTYININRTTNQPPPTMRKSNAYMEHAKKQQKEAEEQTKIKEISDVGLARGLRRQGKVFDANLLLAKYGSLDTDESEFGNIREIESHRRMVNDVERAIQKRIPSLNPEQIRGHLQSADRFELQNLASNMDNLANAYQLWDKQNPPGDFFRSMQYRVLKDINRPINQGLIRDRPGGPRAPEAKMLEEKSAGSRDVIPYAQPSKRARGSEGPRIEEFDFDPEINSMRGFDEAPSQGFIPYFLNTDFLPRGSKPRGLPSVARKPRKPRGSTSSVARSSDASFLPSTRYEFDTDFKDFKDLYRNVERTRQDTKPPKREVARPFTEANLRRTIGKRDRDELKKPEEPNMLQFTTLQPNDELPPLPLSPIGGNGLRGRRRYNFKL